jgi:hypothetical protein
VSPIFNPIFSNHSDVFTPVPWPLSLDLIDLGIHF